MTTQDEIVRFLVEHQDSSPPEIAAGIFMTQAAVRKQLRCNLRDLVVKTHNRRGSTPSRWRVREDADWCPLCERVRE